MTKTTVAILVLLSLAVEITSFLPSIGVNARPSLSHTFMSGDDEPKKGGFFGAIGNFFDELDAFVDDATSRRLGGGAAFYGKRKSSFYGESDAAKKSKKDVADPSEDYRGPANAGYFQWMRDDDGNMVPVTRMKNKNIERNPKLWKSNNEVNDDDDDNGGK